MPIFLAKLLNIKPGRPALLLIGAALFCIISGGAIFAATQHLPLTTGWYWAITTATTVGYGTVTPKNPSGRLVASVVMLTTIPLLAGAFALITGSAVAKGVRRLLEIVPRFPDGSYILVLGMHPAIPVVLEELESADNAIVLVADVDPASVPHHVHLIKGDPSDEHVLARGRPRGASRILIAADDDGDVLVIAVLVRQEAPDVPVTALVSSHRLIPALKDLGVLQVLSPDDLTGHTVAKGLEAPHASDLLMHLVRGEGHRLVEHVVGAEEPTRSLSAIRGERRELVLGVVRGSYMSLGVADDPEVQPGDLLLLVEPNGVRRHEHRAGGSPRHPQSAIAAPRAARSSDGAPLRG
ncbi:MAG: ion channel [Actinomycetota bacterium]|jgi:voltage-gated potassium channel|nr:ion channel [Actinomycetota bacterium]